LVFSIYNMIIKEKSPLAAVIIFAGITPFAFLSVLGTIYSYILAFNLCKMYLIIKLYYKFHIKST